MELQGKEKCSEEVKCSQSVMSTAISNLDNRLKEKEIYVLQGDLVNGMNEDGTIDDGTNEDLSRHEESNTVIYDLNIDLKMPDSTKTDVQMPTSISSPRSLNGNLIQISDNAGLNTIGVTDATNEIDAEVAHEGDSRGTASDMEVGRASTQESAINFVLLKDIMGYENDGLYVQHAGVLPATSSTAVNGDYSNIFAVAQANLVAETQRNIALQLIEQNDNDICNSTAGQIVPIPDTTSFLLPVTIVRAPDKGSVQNKDELTNQSAVINPASPGCSTLKQGKKELPDAKAVNTPHSVEGGNFTYILYCDSVTIFIPVTHGKLLHATVHLTQKAIFHI